MTVTRSSYQRSVACCRQPSGRAARIAASGFTLIELLAVLAIIAVLAALLLPALGEGRLKSQRVGCQSNLRQLALSVQMYCADNEGKLPENYPGGEAPNIWVRGNLARAEDATNQVLISQGKLFPYASHAKVFRCPADTSQSYGLPRVRSYSMNGWTGSRYMDNSVANGKFRTFVRESELSAAGPSGIWIIQDEHELSIDDAWFLVTMDDSRPFASFPATRHDRAYVSNFGDGHVELTRLRDPESEQMGRDQHEFSANNSDWIHLKELTTIR